MILKQKRDFYLQLFSLLHYYLQTFMATTHIIPTSK